LILTANVQKKNKAISNNKEDCGCNPEINVKLDEIQSELQSVNKLLNRVKVVTNLVSILSMKNPEIREKRNKILEEIYNSNVNNHDLNLVLFSNEPASIICDTLAILVLNFYTLALQFAILSEYYSGRILGPIFASISYSFGFIFMFYAYLYYDVFLCEFPPKLLY
jgi:hypothetical protein